MVDYYRTKSFGLAEADKDDLWRRLCAEHATQELNYDLALLIKTPVMYNSKHPDIYYKYSTKQMTEVKLSHPAILNSDEMFDEMVPRPDLVLTNSGSEFYYRAFYLDKELGAMATLKY